MVIVGSDHSGIELKKKIINYLYSKHIEYVDATKENKSDDDYPDIAVNICNKVLENSSNLAIAICGTGIGISIACNKKKNIMAALCTDKYMAKYARLHNKANVLCLGARLECMQDFEKVKTIIESFLNSFYEGGRHDKRLEKIREIESFNTRGDN